MNPQFEIQLIAVIISVSCALPGAFLVLRKMAMMSDSITHTILLGIVLAFFATGDMSSPLLITGAAAVGVITVWLTEMLVKTRLVVEDSAIGIIFPLLFSIAVILITRYASSVHIDTDSVMLGELAFAPFRRMVVAGRDIGARAIYTSGALLVINIVLTAVFFKELALATFDPLLATVLGFSPAFIYYGLMTLVSVTAVGAFEAVGSILVVAFMAGPPVTAYLLTDDLKTMLVFSGCFSVLGAIFGCRLASLFDVSIAGSITVVIGLLFMLVLCFAPKKGLIAVLLRKARQRREFAKNTLLIHVCKNPKCILCDARSSLRWDDKKLRRTVCDLLREQKIELRSGYITATQHGVDSAGEFLRGIFDDDY
ncbi:MAG: metal ABC transporter permease [Clostridiales bacterium]|nr:metal ABC transporter permease [Clostridiales bacterium]